MRSTNVDNVACAHGVKSKTHILSPNLFSPHARKQHFSTIANQQGERRENVVCKYDWQAFERNIKTIRLGASLADAWPCENTSETYCSSLRRLTMYVIDHMLTSIMPLSHSGYRRRAPTVLQQAMLSPSYQLTAALFAAGSRLNRSAARALLDAFGLLRGWRLGNIGSPCTPSPLIWVGACPPVTVHPFFFNLLKEILNGRPS